MAGSSTVKDLGAPSSMPMEGQICRPGRGCTMATMTTEPYLTHVPTMTGGTGRAEVENFYHISSAIGPMTFR